MVSRPASCSRKSIPSSLESRMSENRKFHGVEVEHTAKDRIWLEPGEISLRCETAEDLLHHRANPISSLTASPAAATGRRWGPQCETEREASRPPLISRCGLDGENRLVRRRFSGGSEVADQLERTQVRCSDDQAPQEMQARGSANARRGLGVSSPREDTFDAPEPAIHVGWMRSSGP